MKQDIKQEEMQVLKRIESRIVRGFSELGIDVQADTDWLTVQGADIYLTTMGRSLQAIRERAVQQGAKLGEIQYDLWFRNEWVASI